MSYQFAEVSRLMGFLQQAVISVLLGSIFDITRRTCLLRQLFARDSSRASSDAKHNSIES
jgi:hypothetical protein